MPVAVERLGDRGVPHKFLQDLGVELSAVAHRRDHERRERVPSLVEADRLAPLSLPPARGAALRYFDRPWATSAPAEDVALTPPQLHEVRKQGGGAVS